MYSKVLASLLGNRIQPAKKFPQIRLKPKEHYRLTRHRQCSLSLAAFYESNVEFASREYSPGQVVEVRKDDCKLIALGFFEPQLDRVDVFDLSPPSVSMLPTIDEDFFITRVQSAWQRRRSLMDQGLNNTYRIVNGCVDGLPNLYIDVFSESFARVIATSLGAERLVPAVADFLQRRNAEEILLDTPSLGSDQSLVMMNPTLSMDNVYVESGIRYLWIRRDMRLPTLENRYLINPAYRRARRMVRELSKEKRVLCINDPSGSASLNAVMTAKRVTVIDLDHSTLGWVRENIVANHSTAVFKLCDVVHASGLNAIQLQEQQDVVYLEHHPTFLATKKDWERLIKGLIQKNIIGVGTVLVISQEAAPLGISDLLLRRSQRPGVGLPADCKAVRQLVRDAAKTSRLHTRFLRAFSASCDFPLMPGEASSCFSYVFLIEEREDGDT